MRVQAPFWRKKLDTVINFVNSSNSQVIQKPCTRFNTNQHIDKQRRFFSTKKKISLKRKVNKPTLHEKTSIIEGLKDTEQVSVNVHTEDDHSYFIS